MKISTKGRYALRVLVDLAELQEQAKLVTIKQIIEKQNLSEKYVESIFSILSKADIVEGFRGKNGGYRLKVAPEEISVLRILKLTEGGTAPVKCLEENSACPRSAHCKTLKLWQGLSKCMDDYLEGVSIKDLMDCTEE